MATAFHAKPQRARRFPAPSGTFVSAGHLHGMPRYFFDIYHDNVHLDNEGEELADQHAAWKEATVTAGKILQDIDGQA